MGRELSSGLDYSSLEKCELLLVTGVQRIWGILGARCRDSIFQFQERVQAR